MGERKRPPLVVLLWISLKRKHDRGVRPVEQLLLDCTKEMGFVVSKWHVVRTQLRPVDGVQLHELLLQHLAQGAVRVAHDCIRVEPRSRRALARGHEERDVGSL